MNKKLFVGNLSYAVTRDDLAQIFTEAGTVAFVRVITDRMTGRSKGFGFVEMSTPEEAQEAIRILNGRDVAGRTLKVTEARELEDAPRRSSYNQDRGDRGYDRRPHHGHSGGYSQEQQSHMSHGNVD